MTQFSTLKAFIAANMTSVITTLAFFVLIVGLGYAQVAPTGSTEFVSRTGMTVTVYTVHAHDNDEEVVFTANGVVRQWDENAGKTVLIPCVMRESENKTTLFISGHAYTGDMSEMSTDEGWYAVDNLK